MLSHEWRELEVLCDRIANLRERLATARKSRNPGLMENLKTEIDVAQRQREALVQHISARLGSVAAIPPRLMGSGPPGQQAAPEPEEPDRSLSTEP